MAPSEIKVALDFLACVRALGTGWNFILLCLLTYRNQKSSGMVLPTVSLSTCAPISLGDGQVDEQDHISAFFFP